MLSEVQFSNQSMSLSKQAMPEKVKYEGPSSLRITGSENSFAANAHTPLAKPGFSE
jgi:hypothetical protein